MTRFARVRHWLPLLPLLGLLGVTYWLNQQVRYAAPSPETRAQHYPDGIMENFSAITLDQDGKPKGEMRGKKLLHFPDKNNSEVWQPTIISLAAGKPPVYITAQHATISQGGSEVLLEQQVNVRRVADAKRTALTVDTAHLRVLPDKNWCETDQAVRVVEGNNTLTAVGMEMDNQAQTLKLRAQVRSEYVLSQK